MTKTHENIPNPIPVAVRRARRHGDAGPAEHRVYLKRLSPIDPVITPPSPKAPQPKEERSWAGPRVPTKGAKQAERLRQKHARKAQR